MGGAEEIPWVRCETNFRVYKDYLWQIIYFLSRCETRQMIKKTILNLVVFFFA